MTLPNLIFLGAAGSGKGTQAQRFSKKFNVHQLSTGDILRAALKAETPIGLKAKSFIDSGALVPDDVVLEMIEDKLSQSDIKQDGFILDGFPRTLPQAEGLDQILSDQNITIDHVILFDISIEEAMQRIYGRRTCSTCNKIYHIDNAPPKSPDRCDTCNTVLVQRKDDNKEAIQKRHKIYLDQTEPLINYYEDRLITVSATQSTEDIFKSIATLYKVKQ